MITIEMSLDHNTLVLRRGCDKVQGKKKYIDFILRLISVKKTDVWLYPQLGCITVQPGGNIRLNCTSVSTSSTNPAAEHQPTLLPVQTNQHHCENQLNESHNTNHSPLAHIRDGRQTDSKLQQQQQEKDQKQENKEDRQPHQKVERQEEDVSVANADLALVCLLQQLVASDIICRR